MIVINKNSDSDKTGQGRLSVPHVLFTQYRFDDKQVLRLVEIIRQFIIYVKS